MPLASKAALSAFRCLARSRRILLSHSFRMSSTRAWPARRSCSSAEPPWAGGPRKGPGWTGLDLTCQLNQAEPYVTAETAWGPSRSLSPCFDENFGLPSPPFFLSAPAR